MAGRKRPELDDLEDLDYLDQEENPRPADVETARHNLPGDVSRGKLLQTFSETGENAFLIDDQVIGAYCSNKGLDKARHLVAAGQPAEKSFDGETISATVVDQGRACHPQFLFTLARYGCDCNEPGDGGCSHVATLMLAWQRDHLSFLPTAPNPSFLVSLRYTPYGRFFASLLGENDMARVMERLRSSARTGAPSQPRATPTDAGSSGVYWPQASAIRLSQTPLKDIIDAEFNTAQLRELARTLGIKLKSGIKSALTEQVADAILARVAAVRDNPAAMLEGLSPEHAAFVQRALTASDYQLPLRRNLINSLWSQLVNKDPDIHVTDLIETLRRRAMLFPTHKFTGYHDVYYQWVPLEGSGGNLPLATWPRSTVAAKAPPQANLVAERSHFLENFDRFLHAILTSGTEIRATLPVHPKAPNTYWLQNWEHSAKEAEALLNSRPGWAPNPQSGISVPLLSPLTGEATAQLESQTGFSAAQCEFLFALAATLQLIVAPEPLENTRQMRGAFRPIPAPWRVQVRADAIEQWLALANEEQFLRAWMMWCEWMVFPNEVQHAAGADSSARFRLMRALGAREWMPGDLATEWCALRRYVIRTLRGLPRNEWIAWRDFRKTLFDFYPNCSWVLANEETWWFGEPNKSARMQAARYEDWLRTLGAIIEKILVESLRWFGVIEVVTVENELQMFRLTDLFDWVVAAQTQVQAAALSGRTPSTYPIAIPTAWQAGSLLPLPSTAVPRPHPAEPVMWLDERQWRLPAAPDRADFIAFARRIADPGDAPFTYKLTPASIERALSHGIGLEATLDQFEKMGAPMPPAARELFNAIADHFGRVRVYESLTVLQLADDYALRELMSNTSLAQHVVYQMSPRTVVVQDNAVDTLVEEMVARGYTPAVKP